VKDAVRDPLSKKDDALIVDLLTFLYRFPFKSVGRKCDVDLPIVLVVD